jgi:hypothetical protein
MSGEEEEEATLSAIHIDDTNNLSNSNVEEEDSWLYGPEGANTNNNKDSTTPPNSNNDNNRNQNLGTPTYDDDDDAGGGDGSRDPIASDTNLDNSNGIPSFLTKSSMMEEEDTIYNNNNHSINGDELKNDTEVTENSEINNNNQQNDDDDEDDDDDDDDDDDGDNVKVVISDIVNKPYSQAASNANNLNGLQWQKSKSGASNTTAGTVNAAGVVGTATGTAVKLKGVDLEAPGVINEGPTYDYDLQEVKDEDKPWRKPGADITDYFNYGFTEETWIGYCMKQKRLRQENQLNIKTGMYQMNQQPPTTTLPTNNINNPIQSTSIPNTNGSFPNYSNQNQFKPGNIQQPPPLSAPLSSQPITNQFQPNRVSNYQPRFSSQPQQPPPSLSNNNGSLMRQQQQQAPNEPLLRRPPMHDGPMYMNNNEMPHLHQQQQPSLMGPNSGSNNNL